MKVDVALTNTFTRGDLIVDIKNCVCAVIDVIRATTTIAVIFGSGADSIIIASSLEEAFKLKEYFPKRILCGEKNVVRPDGFNFGNSPLEFSKIDLTGKKVIFKTTNGTVSFLKVRKAPAVFSLASINLDYTVDFIVNYAYKNSRDVLIICSGQEGKIAYDDTYIAGLAVKRIMTKPYNFNYSESAKLVLSSVLGDKDIKGALLRSVSAKILLEAGFEDDVEYCSRLNVYDLLIESSVMNSKENKMDFEELLELKIYKGRN